MCPPADNYSLIADFYQAYRSELLQFATARLGNAFVAEDIVQDVFLRLLQSNQLITPVTLPNLVYTIAMNIIRDQWRHQHAVEQYEHFIKTANSDGSYDAQSVYSAREMLEIMERGVARLSNNQQFIYRMNVYGGLKVSEISDTLQINYKSVENHLGTARKQVRKYMRRMLA